MKIFKTLKEFGCEEEKRDREVTSEDYGGFANCYIKHGLNAARKESLEKERLVMRANLPTGWSVDTQ